MRKKVIWVAVRLPGQEPAQRAVTVRRFKAFWRSLQKMSGWLAVLGVAGAAMESSGVQNRMQRGEEGAQKTNRVTQLMQRAGIGGAIVVGVLVFAPTVQYLAGLQVIATAEHRVAAAVLWILLAAVVNAALVWLFLIAYLANPHRTKAHLDKANTWVDWVKAHREAVVRVVLVIVGVYLVINGAVGLTK